MVLDLRKRHSLSSSPGAVFGATSLAMMACLEIPDVTASTETSLVLAIFVMVSTAASIIVVFPEPTAPTIATETGMASLVSMSAPQ